MNHQDQPGNFCDAKGFAGQKEGHLQENPKICDCKKQ